MINIRSALIGLAVLASAAPITTAQVGKPTRVQRQQVARARAARQALVVRSVTRGLFRGIQLSDAEKTHLKAVREAYKPKVQELRNSFVTDRKALRELRQGGDTAAFRAQFKKTTETERAQARTLLDAMRTDMRGALTAENQAKFDANAARIRDRLANRADFVAKRLRRPNGQRQGRSPSA
jgi:hypothetical protein